MARILVVDDEKNVRTSIAIALRREGHEVETASSGEEGLARVRVGNFDLVITDVRMDGMDGMELLAAIKDENPETEVIVVTAYGSIEDAVAAMRAGAHNYLRKPFQAADVGLVVEKALEHRELVRELSVLKRSSEQRDGFQAIVGNSRAMKELLELVAKVAETDSTVLITGETGTGKELIGRAIHQASRRRDRVLCTVNSAAFPESLLESELFGHRRGAFTGANANKKGLFEAAHRGTVFLDEVAEMPPSMQAKLLRFLQTGEIRPVGGETTRCVDVRLITATNKDLEAEVAAGRFREDLYYRLAVIPVHVPPLRERREDIPLLAMHFLRRFARKLGKPVESISRAALDRMIEYRWPGNVRELENSIERGVALCRGAQLELEDLPRRLRDPVIESPGDDELQSLEALERAHILRTLDRVGWNRRRAAEILKISTTTLWRRLKEFGIEGPGMHAGRAL